MPQLTGHYGRTGGTEEVAEVLASETLAFGIQPDRFVAQTELESLTPPLLVTRELDLLDTTRQPRIPCHASDSHSGWRREDLKELRYEVGRSVWNSATLASLQVVHELASVGEHLFPAEKRVSGIR